MIRSRSKIKELVATNQPVLDKQCPGVLEEARYWCSTRKTRTRRTKQKASLTTEVEISSSSATPALTDGFSQRYVPAPSLDRGKLMEMVTQSVLACSTIFAITFWGDAYCGMNRGPQALLCLAKAHLAPAKRRRRQSPKQRPRLSLLQEELAWDEKFEKMCVLSA